MRLGIHVQEIAKTPATIGYDKQHTSCGIRRQISLVPWLFLVEPGYEAIYGARGNGPGMWQLLPSICMLSVWRALKRHSECPCSTSGEEEDAT